MIEKALKSRKKEPDTMRSIRCLSLIGFVSCLSFIGVAHAQPLPRPVDQPGEMPSPLGSRPKKVQLTGHSDSDPNATTATGSAQEPAMPSSQPEPSTPIADTQPAATSQNTFAGNPPVQDLSNLFVGNFQNTKYRWYGFVRVDSIFDYNPIASTDDFVTSSIP